MVEVEMQKNATGSAVSCGLCTGSILEKNDGFKE